MLDVLCENLDTLALDGGGDRAVGPVDTVRQAELAVEVEGGQAVGFTRYCQVWMTQLMKAYWD